MFRLNPDTNPVEIKGSVSLVALLFAHPCLDLVRFNPLNSLLDWLGWLAHVVRSVGWLVCVDVGKMFVD